MSRENITLSEIRHRQILCDSTPGRHLEYANAERKKVGETFLGWGEWAARRKGNWRLLGPESPSGRMKNSWRWRAAMLVHCESTYGHETVHFQLFTWSIYGTYILPHTDNEKNFKRMWIPRRINAKSSAMCH